jgi:hypothetical protein
MKSLRCVLAVAACLLLARCAWSDSAPKENPLPGKGEAARAFQIANKRYGDLLRPKDAAKAVSWHFTRLDDGTAGDGRRTGCGLTSTVASVR